MSVCWWCFVSTWVATWEGPRYCGGDRTAARANYERALDWATKIRYQPEVALTRFELAKLLLSEAEDTTASDSAAVLQSETQAHLDFAISEFEAMKMQPALEQALCYKREGKS